MLPLLNTLKRFLLRQIGVGPPQAWHSRPKSPLQLCSGSRHPQSYVCSPSFPFLSGLSAQRHLSQLRHHLGSAAPELGHLPLLIQQGFHFLPPYWLLPPWLAFPPLYTTPQAAHSVPDRAPQAQIHPPLLNRKGHQQGHQQAARKWQQRH